MHTATKSRAGGLQVPIAASCSFARLLQIQPSCRLMKEAKEKQEPLEVRKLPGLSQRPPTAHPSIQEAAFTRGHEMLFCSSCVLGQGVASSPTSELRAMPSRVAEEQWGGGHPQLPQSPVPDPKGQSRPGWPEWREDSPAQTLRMLG